MNFERLCLQEILEIEQIMDENQGLELTEGNIETVLDEIRPYLVGQSFCQACGITTLKQRGDALPT